MDNFKFSTLEYQRPDFEQFKKHCALLAEQVKNAKSYEEVKKVILDLEEKSSALDTATTIVFIRNTLDTSDSFYEKETEFLDNEYPTVMPAVIELYKTLIQSSFAKEITEDYGDQFLFKLQFEVDKFNDDLIPFMQKEAQLTTSYQKLMASAKIPFEGETLNLYGIQKYFEHPDREIRKRAFKAYSDFYHSNEEKMEQIFADLIEVRNEMGKKLGFENFIPLGYMNQRRSDYGQEQVASFREQVRKELVPLCSKLYEAQAKRIGVDKIMVYDEEFIFPDGNPELIGDEAFLVKEAQKMYHELSPETGEFIDFMLEHDLMDLSNKPNKASTGYMTTLTQYKAPFVFSCFNNTIGDIQVLTHELGHAFAGYEAMRNQKTDLYYSMSTDIAEIHSMSMEQFSYPYAERFFGKDADKFRFAHLQQAITFVPFGVAVDEFQHIMYASPQLTPKERTYEWHKLEEKYMPWRTYSDDEFMERGGYWYHKLHIFQYPFYYINYTLTTMGAMEFKKRYAEDPKAAWNDYLELCKAGGSRSYLGLLKLANLSVPFEEGSVAKAISYAKDILLKEIEKMEATI